MLGSDAIVTGTIDALSEERFTLRVETVLAGTVQGPTIDVLRFEDWMCAGRWAPYARGQRVLLFLNGSPQGWRILSAGGEGEMPIEGDTVYVGGLMDLAPPGVPVERHAVYGGAIVGFAASLTEFSTLIRAARACFRATVRANGPHVETVQTVCASSAMAELRATPLGARLADTMPR